jgi:voltage-gated potassium channel
MSDDSDAPPPPDASHWRRRVHQIIFEADTPLGKFFDIALFVAIVLSVSAVMLETVSHIDAEYHTTLRAAEWVFTVLFTIEYILRLLCVKKPMRYALSFYGIVDLLSILPTWSLLLMPDAGAQSVLVIRTLRLLRIFRVFKLTYFLTEGSALWSALWQSRAKITVFIMTVVIVVSIMGAAMHLVEGSTNPGFDSIPQSMYWAIVTMATVGYGDIVPHTPLGKTLAAAIIMFGYSLIIVPTGIVTAEISQQTIQRVVGGPRRVCDRCGRADHLSDASFCRHCGNALPAGQPEGDPG